MPLSGKLKHLPRKLRRILGRPGDFDDQLYFALVRRGDFVFDIGANKGDVSLLLSRLAGSTGKVISFEPVWPAYEKLCTVIRKRRRGSAPIVPVPCGLDQAPGTREIGVPNGNFGLASLAPGDTWAEIQHGAAMTRYSCEFVTLDGYRAAKQLPSPDFMKIDVEGAERFVFEGATELLSGPEKPLMLVEVFAPWQRAFGYGPWELLSLLAGYGYGFLFACPEGLVEHRPTAEEPMPPAYVGGYNIVAYAPDRHCEQLRNLDPLRVGTGRRVLAMTPPPRPNVLAGQS